MEVIRLTENQLHKLIKEASFRLIREYIGDAQEFGRYDIEDGIPPNHLDDDEYEGYQDMIAQSEEDYDAFQKYEEWQGVQDELHQAMYDDMRYGDYPAVNAGNP